MSRKSDSLNALNVDSIIQLSTALEIVKVIADTHSPSQTVHYTRAPKIQRVLQEFGDGRYKFDLNYKNTGNALLSLNDRPTKILFLAHADEISYLVGHKCSDGSWALIPFCNNDTKGEYEAVALRYQLSSKALESVARGKLGCRDGGNPYFSPAQGSVQFGDRLVYDHPLSFDGDIIRGNIDNSAGVAACLLAALALRQVAPDAPISFAFTDEEEGPPISSLTFARGARRLFRGLSKLPDLCVVVDGHDISEWCSLGDGAVFAEKASLCKGVVVPPHLYLTFKELAADMMACHRSCITENPGDVSRSDDVACMEVTPNILLLGYPVKDPHFNQAVPAASLIDIVNLAKAIFWTAIGLVV